MSVQVVKVLPMCGRAGCMKPAAGGTFRYRQGAWDLRDNQRAESYWCLKHKPKKLPHFSRDTVRNVLFPAAS